MIGQESFLDRSVSCTCLQHPKDVLRAADPTSAPCLCFLLLLLLLLPLLLIIIISCCCCRPFLQLGHYGRNQVLNCLCRGIEQSIRRCPIRSIELGRMGRQSKNARIDSEPHLRVAAVPHPPLLQQEPQLGLHGRQSLDCACAYCFGWAGCAVACSFDPWPAKATHTHIPRSAAASAPRCTSPPPPPSASRLPPARLLPPPRAMADRTLSVGSAREWFSVRRALGEQQARHRELVRRRRCVGCRLWGTTASSARGKAAAHTGSDAAGLGSDTFCTAGAFRPIDRCIYKDKEKSSRDYNLVLRSLLRFISSNSFL